MDLSGSGSDLGDYSEYSYVTTPSNDSVDTMQDLLQRFTIDCQPEYTLKLRHLVGPVVVGMDVSHAARTEQNGAALVLKPAQLSRWWRRLRVDSKGTLTLRSTKLRWWLFTLDVEGHANPLTPKAHMSFRVATKWDVARGQWRNKRRFEMGDRSEARVHYSVNYNLPEIEGSFGAAANRRVSRQVHTDVGYAHLELPRAELVVWPFGRKRSPLEPQQQQDEEGEAGEVQQQQQQQQPGGSAWGEGGSRAALEGPASDGVLLQASLSSAPAAASLSAAPAADGLMELYLPEYMRPQAVDPLAEAPQLPAPTQQRRQQQHHLGGGEGGTTRPLEDLRTHLRTHVRSLAAGLWEGFSAIVGQA